MATRSRTRGAQLDDSQDQLLAGEDIQRLIEYARLTPAEFFEWLQAALGDLLAWQWSVIEDSKTRAELLLLLGEDRGNWNSTAAAISKEDKIEKLDGVDAKSLCAQAAHEIATAGRKILDQTEGRDPALWHHECALRVLFAVVADFQDHANGYFVGLLGAPKPSMHLEKQSRQRGGRPRPNLAADHQITAQPSDRSTKKRKLVALALAKEDSLDLAATTRADDEDACGAPSSNQRATTSRRKRRRVVDDDDVYDEKTGGVPVGAIRPKAKKGNQKSSQQAGATEQTAQPLFRLQHDLKNASLMIEHLQWQVEMRDKWIKHDGLRLRRERKEATARLGEKDKVIQSLRYGGATREWRQKYEELAKKHEELKSLCDGERRKVKRKDSAMEWLEAKMEQHDAELERMRKECADKVEANEKELYRTKHWLGEVVESCECHACLALAVGAVVDRGEEDATE